MPRRFLFLVVWLALVVLAIGWIWPAASRKARLVGAAAASILAGGLLEAVQSLLPYRSAELLDFVADAGGAVAVALLLGLILRLPPAAR